MYASVWHTPVAMISTSTSPGRGPAMSIVYYVTDGEDLLVSTMADRAKAKAVRRGGNDQQT